MSDGDNATPGPRHPSLPLDTGADNQWLTRSRPPSLGAAPWERIATPKPDQAESQETAGNHTEGVTVADLIAKINGDAGTSDGPTRRSPTPDRPTRRGPTPDRPTRRGPTPERLTRRRPTLDPLPDPSAHDVEQTRAPYQRVPIQDPDNADTEVIPLAPAWLPEIPDLAERRPRPDLSDQPPSPDVLSEPRRRRAPHRRRKTIVAGRSAAALIAVSAMTLTGGAWQYQSVKNGMLNHVSALDPDSHDIVDPNAQHGDENFLVVGVDSRFGDNSQMGAGNTQDAGGTRSDTVMLVHIPANRKRVVVVSFPRDLAITPLKCQAWNDHTGEYGPQYDDQTKSYGPDEVYTETKLNSAYAFGGPKCLVKEIQKLSGLSINRFMAADFAGFAKMVDAIGGVEVCSKTPLQDYEIGTVLANAGRQTLDGRGALQYVRARQVTTEFNGDYGRIKRQQLFLSSLLRSMISKEVFFSLPKLNDLVNMFISNTRVDNIKAKDLVNLGQSLQGVNAGRVTFVTVPTTGVTDPDGNEPPRTDDMRSLFTAIINDNPLPEEKNADNTPVPDTPQPAPNPPATPAPSNAELVSALATNPQDITVRVSNSTGQNGLAATAANELQNHGFNVTAPDDYPGPLNSTTVFFSQGNEQAAATVASAFANPTIERVSGMGDMVRVVLGSDFYSVMPPSPTGSPVQVHVVPGTSNVGADTSTAPIHLPADLTVTNAADTTCQ